MQYDDKRLRSYPFYQFFHKFQVYSQNILMQVYNLKGRKLETIISSTMEAGYHTVTWNADQYSSGLYFVRMTAGDFSSVQKLMLLK